MMASGGWCSRPLHRSLALLSWRGWSGMVTIEAMRFACDHKMALVLLDWSREFLNIVSAPAKTSAELVRCQVTGGPQVGSPRYHRSKD